VNSYFWLILGLWFTSEFNPLTALDEYIRPKTACIAIAPRTVKILKNHLRVFDRE